MNKIRNYWKNKKGMTLVWGAFFLVLLLMLAGMAIDLGYMYFVKNQLQVAADAAALAGGANIARVYDTSTVAFNQLVARQEAWKFACKNKATDRAVFLVTDDGRSPVAPNCDSPPTSDLNEGANTATDDIVVGHWQRTCPTGFSCGTGLACEPAGGGYFCRATGATQLKINALKARPRMTGEPGTPMPKVGVFVGQIFRFIGIDWSSMSASANAIALLIPPTFGPMPVCTDTCIELPQTPLTGSPPGILLQIQQPSGPERIAWTDFQPVPGDPSWKRNKADDPPGIFELLGVDKVQGNWVVKQPEPPPDECNSGNCLRSKQGVGNALDAFPAILAARGANHTVRGFSIFGWKMIIPVFDPCSPSGPNPCPGDQPSGYRLVQAVEVIVTGVITSGPNAGIYVVGLDENADAGKSKLNCVPCDDPSIQQTAKAHLVK